MTTPSKSQKKEEIPTPQNEPASSSDKPPESAAREEIEETPVEPVFSRMEPLAGEEILLSERTPERLSGATLRAAIEAIAALTREDTGVVREGFPGDVSLVYHFSLRVHGNAPFTYGSTMELHSLLSADGLDTAPAEFEAGISRILRPLQNRIMALANLLSAPAIRPSNVTRLPAPSPR